MAEGPRLGICSGLEGQSWLGVTLTSNTTGTTIHQATTATTWVDVTTLQVTNLTSTDVVLYAKCGTTIISAETITGFSGQNTVVWYGVDGKVLKMYGSISGQLRVIGQFGRLLRTS